jgi:TRAP-type C4-dicarboxylate transport system permease small subunit
MRPVEGPSSPAAPSPLLARAVSEDDDDIALSTDIPVERPPPVPGSSSYLEKTVSSATAGEASDAPAPRVRRAHPIGALIIEVPAVIVTFVMMLHITANALMRTFANDPLPDTLEIVQYWYMPIVAFLGFIAAQYRGQHIATDLLFERLPKPAQPYVLCLVTAVSAILSAGFAWFTFQEAMHSFDIRQAAGLTDVAAWPTHFLAPLAFGSLTVQLALAAVRALTRPDTEHVITDPDDVLVLEELERDEEEHARKEQELATTKGDRR